MRTPHAAPARYVLVVEDNPDLRESLALLLRLTGLDVATAENGRVAMDYLREHPPPCLILLDLMMPVMSGWQFLEVGKRDPRLADIPVIVCSGIADREARGSLPGVDAVETKPVDPAHLLETVRRLCA